MNSRYGTGVVVQGTRSKHVYIYKIHKISEPGVVTFMKRDTQLIVKNAHIYRGSKPLIQYGVLFL